MWLAEGWKPLCRKCTTSVLDCEKKSFSLFQYTDQQFLLCGNFRSVLCYAVDGTWKSKNYHTLWRGRWFASCAGLCAGYEKQTKRFSMLTARSVLTGTVHTVILVHSQIRISVWYSISVGVVHLVFSLVDFFYGDVSSRVVLLLTSIFIRFFFSVYSLRVNILAILTHTVNHLIDDLERRTVA